MRIGAEDFAKATIVKPDWYPAVITKYDEETDSKGAGLYVLEAKIEGGEFNEVPLRLQFSEKAMGFAKEFAEALRGKPFTKEEMKAGFTFPEGDKLIGRKLRVHAVNGTWNNRANNQVDGFRPLEAK